MNDEILGVIIADTQLRYFDLATQETFTLNRIAGSRDDSDQFRTRGAVGVHITSQGDVVYSIRKFQGYGGGSWSRICDLFSEEETAFRLSSAEAFVEHDGVLLDAGHYGLARSDMFCNERASLITSKGLLDTTGLDHITSLALDHEGTLYVLLQQHFEQGMQVQAKLVQLNYNDGQYSVGDELMSYAPYRINAKAGIVLFPYAGFQDQQGNDHPFSVLTANIQDGNLGCLELNGKLVPGSETTRFAHPFKPRYWKRVKLLEYDNNRLDVVTSAPTSDGLWRFDIDVEEGRVISSDVIKPDSSKVSSFALAYQSFNDFVPVTDQGLHQRLLRLGKTNRENGLPTDYSPPANDYCPVAP